MTEVVGSEEPFGLVDLALPDDRGGAVLCERFDAVCGESAFLVFDAFDIAAGPRAVLPLESPLHLGFHGVFASDPH